MANGLTPPQTPEQHPAALKDIEIPNMSNTLSKDTATQPPVGTFLTKQENPQQQSSTVSPVASASTASTFSHASSEAGYSFGLGQVTDAARALQVVPEGAAFARAPEGQKISFNTNMAAGNSRLIQGTVTHEQYLAWLQN
ncbi:hypothetical protein LTR84_006070 [Exophiala bonariae]|uniref:Uncharacterized protein n=1 Tax=Exophiala bonariae TaxID=1690606 RepID=A0AAV9N1Q2_9EURO|nr:hypothetical protein LTR84_006070 [Exophiala bonariae]